MEEDGRVLRAKSGACDIMPHSGGKAQVNLYAPSNIYSNTFINQVKPTGRGWRLMSSGTVTSVAQDWWTLLDDDGYPTAPATGSDFWAITDLNVYLELGDTIVLTWEGTSVLSLTNTNGNAPPSMSLASTAANRKTYTITASSFTSAFGVETRHVVCNIRMTTFGTCSNVRLFLGSYESDLDAGEYYYPDVKDQLSGWKSIRFMDWQGTNGTSHSGAGGLKDETHCSWRSVKIDNSVYCGVASYGAHTNDITVPTRSGFTALTDGYEITFTATHNWCEQKAVTSGANSSGLITMTCASHGLVTGDIVLFPYRTNNPPTNLGFYINLGQYTTSSTPRSDYGRWREQTVTVVDPDTFTIDNLDASTWGAFPAAGNITFCRRPTITYGGTTYPVTGDFGRSFVGIAGTSFRRHMVYARWDEVFQRWKTDGSQASVNNPDYGVNQGVPVEVMLKTCADAGAYPWFCIATQYTYDATETFMQRVKDWIDSNATWMIPRLEKSNEVWNGGPAFPQTPYFAFKAELSGLSGDDIHNRYGYEVTRMADAADAVWSNRSARKICLMWQSLASNTFINRRLQATPYFGSTSNSLWPVYRADVIGAATYIKTPFFSQRNASLFPDDYPGLTDAVYGYLQGGAQRVAAFDYMRDAFIDTAIATGWEANDQRLTIFQTAYWPNRTSRLATYPHLEWEEYEGGFGNFGTDGIGTNQDQIIYGFPSTHAASGQTITVDNVRNFVFDFRRSSQAGEVITAYCEACEADGGTPAIYCLSAKLTTTTMWTITDPMATTGVVNIPSYTAAKAFNAGTAPTPGDPTSWTAVCTL